MELIALVLALALAGALVTLPFISLVRSFMLSRQIAALAKRLSEVEAAVRRMSPPAEPAEQPAAAPAPPSTPVPTPTRAPAPTPTPTTAPASAPQPQTMPVAAPAAPAPPAAPIPQATAATRAEPAEEDLETVLGGRWLLYAGLLVLLFGVAFFLKYAFDNAWLDRRARCALGAMGGFALIASGLRLANRGYERYGQLLSGAGIVVFFLTTYAALELYGIVPRWMAIGLFLLITGAGAWLADRQKSPGLAVLAIAGGYATPLLVSSGRDAQLTLFSYIALLIAGTMFLARRHDWPRVNLASYGFTLMLVALWADRFYTTAKYLRTELFLTLYCAMFLFIVLMTRRAGHHLVANLLASAPVLYYGASLAILWDLRLALFVFLILFSGAALAASARFRWDWLRLVAWAAAALPFLGRIEHTGPAWTIAMLATATAIAAMHLTAQIHRLSLEPPSKHHAVGPVDITLIHANGVFACTAAYMILEQHWIVGSPWLAWGLAAWFAALAWSVRRTDQEAALHWAGLAFALTAAGTAIRFDGPWVIVTIAAEGVAVAWVALRVRRNWFRLAGLAIVGFACLRWFGLLVEPPTIPWLLVLNTRALSGAFIIGLLYALAWWHRERDEETAGAFTPIVVAAQVMTVALLTSEIDSYWRVRSLTRADAGLAAQLSLSLAWAGYAAALVVVGMRRLYAPIRYVGIALFGLTVLKIFMSDLPALGGIYRVIGFLGVGAVLVLVSFLYQRSRRTKGSAQGL